MSTTAWTWNVFRPPSSAAPAASIPACGPAPTAPPPGAVAEGAIRTTCVLFVCTHNSARSQMAEAILRQQGGEAVDVSSAGSDPSQVHPMAVRTLAELGIDGTGLHAKPLGSFAGAHLNPVVTLADWLFGALRWRAASAYWTAQVLGAMCGTVAANPDVLAVGG